MDCSSAPPGICPDPSLLASDRRTFSPLWSEDSHQRALLLCTRDTVFPTALLLTPGPIVRISPDLVDIQVAELLPDAWRGHNSTKYPWDRDATFQRGARSGLKVDSVVSHPKTRDALRLKRFVNPPFARKFLLDHEPTFKLSAKRIIERIKEIMLQDGRVDVHRQFKLYVFDIISFLSIEID